LALNGFPNLSQRTFRAIDRIIIWNWQSGDLAIGFGPLAEPASEQVPIASIGISANNGKVRARIEFLVSDASWNHNYVAGLHIQIPAALTANFQCRGATVDTENLMRGAVIMSKGIHTVSPRITPVIVSEAFLKKGSGIVTVGGECVPVHQQWQHAVWKNAVVFKPELLRLNKLSRDHGLAGSYI